MKCSKCGNILPDGAKFCIMCGELVTNDQPPVQEPKEEPVSFESQNTEKAQEQPFSGIDLESLVGAGSQEKESPKAPLKPKKPLPVKKLIGAAVALVAVIVAVIVIISQPKKISVTDGVTPVFEGYDGYGTVKFESAVPNNDKYQAMQSKLDEYLSQGVNSLFGGDMSGLGQVGSKAQSLYTFANSLSCEWKTKDGEEFKNGSLKNGDKVVYACKFNEEAGKKAGYVYTDLETEYKVKGLEKVEEIDLFDGVGAEWNLEGNGYGDINLKVTFSNENAEAVNNPNFVVDYRVEYNGDGTATIKANVDDDSLLRAGFAPKNNIKTKNVNVGEKPMVIVNPSDEEAIAAAKEVTKDLIEKAISNCVNKLTNSDDEALNISSYSFKKLQTNYGSSMEIVYEVHTDGDSYLREYTVYVYKMSDGTYKAVTSETENEAHCTVSRWSSYWN